MTQLRISHLSDPRQIASAITGLQRRTDAIDVNSSQSAATVDRDLSVDGNVDVSGHFAVSGTQVVGARNTGWAADTGTADKAAHATYTAPTISNPPTQAEVQAIANALQTATRQIKALKDLALGHGFAGA